MTELVNNRILDLLITMEDGEQFYWKDFTTGKLFVKLCDPTENCPLNEREIEYTTPEYNLYLKKAYERMFECEGNNCVVGKLLRSIFHLRTSIEIRTDHFNDLFNEHYKDEIRKNKNLNVLTLEMFLKELEVFAQEGKGEWLLGSPSDMNDPRIEIAPQGTLTLTVNMCIPDLKKGLEDGKGHYQIEWNPNTKMIEANKPEE